MLQNVR